MRTDLIIGAMMLAVLVGGVIAARRLNRDEKTVHPTAPIPPHAGETP